MKDEKTSVNYDEALLSALKESRAAFDLIEISGKVRKNVRVLSFLVSNRLATLSDGQVKLQNIGRINFKGKNAVKFSKEVLAKLPNSAQLKSFKGKPFYIYPYASPFERWELVGAYPHYFILNRSEIVKGKRVHEYSIVYKLSLSLFKPFHPLSKGQISEGEPSDSHKAGDWRKDANEISNLMLDEFKSRGKDELPIVLALKDGREIRGILNRKRGLRGFCYCLQNESNLKEKAFVFKHAVDDFWIEEDKP